MENNSFLDRFCGSPFWDANLTWYTYNPQLTPCCEKTLLAWVPCIFLWIFCGTEISAIKSSKRRNIPWSWVNISKLSITAFLVILSIAEIISTVSSANVIYNVDIYSPLFKGITLALSVVILYYCRIYGIHTSGLHFLFWLLVAFCGASQFRTEITHGQNDLVPEDMYTNHAIYLIYYPLAILMLFLNCFSDKPPKDTLYPKTANPSPEETASFISCITFSWFDPLILKGFKKPLIAEDLWDMNPEDCCREVVPKFEKHFVKALGKAQTYNASTQQTRAKFKSSSGRVDINQINIKKKTASVFPAVVKTFGWSYLFCSFLMLIQSVMTFVNPQLLGLMITFVRDREELWKGYTYAGLLLGTACVQSLLQNVYHNKVFTMGMRIRSVLISTIYKKALTISNSARRERTVGEIVNLMAVDAQKFMELANHINMLWMAPLQIVLSIFFLWEEMGPSVLAGVAVMIILIPINGVITTRVKKLHMAQMKVKDERVKMMSEILNGMKVLKLYAWEPSFEKNVLNTRHREIKTLKAASYLSAGMSFIWQCAPFTVSLVTFATYVLIDPKNILDANKAYVSLSLFNIIRMPLTMLPNLITSLIQTIVSVKRIDKFMNADDLESDSVYHEPNKEYPLVIENGTFSWGEDPILRDINLKLKVQNLTAVVGSVGAGKSSLISAFLGEMDKVSGRVNTHGSIAYVSQQAWIQNATLKDNIIFGKPLDENLYERVVNACALKPDLEMLPGGDQTEIGEKGINLSGGQKQRVSLARAVYANADVYLFDDPLSAVDSHVGKHIFEHVIGPKGLLKNKTKLLVTHGVTYLPKTDHIVVITDGEVSESGSYQELLSRKGAFAEFLLQHISEDNVDDEELEELKDQLIDTPLSEEVTNRLSRRASKISDGGSVPDLVRNGSLSRQTSKDSGHDKHFNRQISTVSAFGDKKGSKSSVSHGPRNDKDKKGPSKGGPRGRGPPGAKLIELERSETGGVKWDVYTYYLQSIGFIMLVATLILNIISQTLAVGSNVWLGIWADDTTTAVDTGRRDMYLTGYGLLGLGQVIAIVSSNLLFTKATLDAAIKIHHFLLTKMMRLPMAFFDVTPMGRILGRFSNDINGVDLRLPGSFQMILSQMFRVLGTIVVITYTTWMFIIVILVLGIIYVIMQRLYIATSRQLRRLESVSRSPIYSHFGETVTGVQVIRAYAAQDRFILDSEKKIDLNQVCNYPGIISNRWLSIRLEMIGNLIIFFAALFVVQSRDTAPALVGLTISYSLQITQTLNWLVRMTSEIETNIVSVERIKEYGATPQEAAWEIPNKNPPKSWPEVGAVEFQDYGVRYRPGLDLVLSDMSFNIRGGEKVGIVGRTGAGKSSMTLCLFRIIEAAKGKIVIDGVNISEIGLHTLRSKLTIIPQDAVLFSGSLRMNLDPFDEHKDEEVWGSLEHAHLKSFVKGLPAGLQHEVSEGGENLSVGQRQLICLARALLRKTKILILDEATAAVDLETDDLIQNTIRTEFKDCTVITIAHRLNTIMDSDRIIVLDKGKIVEFDSPTSLLANTNSIFASMHKDAGMS